MSSEATDIQTALREMSGSIGGLKSTVDSMASQWARQESTATEGRSKLHAKFDKLQNAVTALDARVDNLSKTVTAIEPTWKKYGDEKLREEGAQRLGLKLWAALLAATGFLGWALHGAINQAMDWVIHLRPPS